MKDLGRAMPGGNRSLGAVSADDLNAAFAEAARLGRVWVNNGEFDSTATGQHITIPPPDDEFYAEITDSGAVSGSGNSGNGSGDDGLNTYGWREMLPYSDGGWIALEGGRSGTTTVNQAREYNGNQSVPVGSIVRMRPAYVSIEDVTLPDGSPDSINTEYRFFFRDCPDTPCPECPDLTDTILCSLVPCFPWPGIGDAPDTLDCSFTSELDEGCTATGTFTNLGTPSAPEYVCDLLTADDPGCDSGSPTFNSYNPITLRNYTPTSSANCCISFQLEIEYVHFSFTNTFSCEPGSGYYFTLHSDSPFYLTIYVPFIGTFEFTEP